MAKPCYVYTPHVGPSRVDIDDCESSPCENGGKCIDTGPLRYRCVCKGDWTGDNCAASKGEKVSLLHITLCASTCGCTPLNGQHARAGAASLINTNIRMDTHIHILSNRMNISTRPEIDDCAPNPCKHGGTCTDNGSAYACKCQEGWEGNNCDSETGSLTYL